MNKLDETGKELEFSLGGLNETTEDFMKSLGGLNFDLNKAGKNTKALTAADLKLIQTQKALAALRKFGIKPTTETDPIQLEAARLNLLKQANLQESERVKTLLANLEAQLAANKAIERYTDLLGVVADSVISPEEVIILSQKWGISKDAVVAYTTAIFAVNDGKISTREVDALAAQWGVTKRQAEVYLDFFAALNDGKLSDEEVNNLANKWNLTNIQVSNYASKIAEGVTPSDLWPTPGNQAAESWRRALQALNNYVAATGGTISAPPSETNLSFKGFGRGGQGTPGTNFPDIPSKPAVDLSGYVDDFMRRDFLGRLIPMANGGIVNSPTTALIGEAGPEAVIPLNRMGSMGGSTVNIVVNGSVTTEGDLVNAIRNAILQGQNNGQAITKTAITL
jgi:hypothetical protein